MFAPTHMAVGALTQAALKRRPETAAVGVLSHAALDNLRFWHAPYPWPEGSPPFLTFLPYPHDLPSSLLLVALIVLTVAVAVLLRRYWWGMLWAVSPDLVDWVVLRPIVGHDLIHGLFSHLSTPWGFVVEVLLIAFIASGLYRRSR